MDCFPLNSDSDCLVLFVFFVVVGNLHAFEFSMFRIFLVSLTLRDFSAVTQSTKGLSIV